MDPVDSSPQHAPQERSLFLLVEARSLVCALPIPLVVETMRFLPIEPIADQPAFVRGLALVRGAPIPVIDLAALLSGAGPERANRLVHVRLGESRAALAVSRVLGVRTLDPAALAEVPRLLHQARAELIESIGNLDDRLLVLLRASRVLEKAAQVPAGRP